MEQTETISNPLKWSSEVDDPETGLTYYNYRHYNPADGRWISRDPIAEQGGINLYVFVYNSPNSNFDTLGNIPIAPIVALILQLLDEAAGYMVSDCSKPKPTTKEKEQECIECVRKWEGIARLALLGGGALGMLGCTTITGGFGVFACAAAMGTIMTLSQNNMTNNVNSALEDCKCE